jgi:hypothetical protein
MKKIAKLFSVVAVAAAACTFFSLNSSNEIICGNIEALSSGDTGAGSEMPEMYSYMTYESDGKSTPNYYKAAGTEGDCVFTYQWYEDLEKKCIRIVYTEEDYLNSFK